MQSQQPSMFRLKSSIYAAQFSSSYFIQNMDSVTHILNKIFRHLDGTSRGSVRLVCHTWKQIIDDEVGLFLRVDDREKSNPCLVRLVRMERLTIHHVDQYEKYISFKYPEFVKMIYAKGPAPSRWFREKVLNKCKGVTRLELTGRFLFSNDLCACNASNNGRPAPIQFEHLKTLIISMDSITCQEYLREKQPQGRLQVVWGALIGCRYQDLYFLRETVDTNVSYLLKTLRGAHLALAYLFVDPMHFEDPKNNYRFEWKSEPLEMFLEFHRNCLQHLYLPTFEGNSKDIYDARLGPFPQQLKTLEISLIQKGRHRKYNFSEKILMGQMQLQDLRLEKTYVGEFKNSDIPKLATMITRNERTLRYVNLTVSAPDHDLLNGSLFQNCVHLETLIFGESPDVLLEFYNLGDLPKGLKTLKIAPILVLKNEDKLGIADFKQLETLVLLEIHLPTTSCSGRHAFLIQFIRNLVRLRQLSQLFTFVSDSPNPEPTYSKALNSMILAFKGRHWRESTEEFRSLEIHGKHCYEQQQAQHFLDTSPIAREQVDPRAKVCVAATSTTKKVHWKNDGNIARDVEVNSNIFKVTPGSRRHEDQDDLSLCDFCAGLYTFTED